LHNKATEPSPVAFSLQNPCEKVGKSSLAEIAFTHICSTWRFNNPNRILHVFPQSHANATPYFLIVGQFHPHVFTLNLQTWAYFALVGKGLQ
jgi:hypothetical protein